MKIYKIHKVSSNLENDSEEKNNFSLNDLSPEDQKQIADTFKKSYDEATGTSWEEGKFYSRARNWIFYGDKDGYVAVRPQRQGAWKLTGVAGNPRSILKGLGYLINENVPLWGVVTQDIKQMMEKKGFKSPPVFLIKIIIPLLPPGVLGGASVENIDESGTISLNYSDVGESNKYFIGNKQYYDWLLDKAEELIRSNPDKVREILKKDSSILKQMGLSKFIQWTISKIPIDAIVNAVKWTIKKIY